MRLVDDAEIILWEIVEKRGWRLALGATFDVTAIVFDAFYEADTFEHFEVVFDALAEALSLEVFMFIIEVFQTIFVFGANLDERAVE